MSANLKNKKIKLPFVFSNFVITADGKIAFSNREFVPFGGKHDHENMMELRATADAVMAGSRTVEPRGVTMGPGGKKFQRLRLARGLSEYNLRIIVSGSGSMNTQADIFKHRFSPIIVLVSERATEKQLRDLRKVSDEVKVFGKTDVDLPAALGWLRDKWKVKRLLCEGGSTLHSAMISAGLLHELHLTMTPKIFGGNEAPSIADGRIAANLADAAQFKLKSTKRIGGELFAVFKKAKNTSF